MYKVGKEVYDQNIENLDTIDIEYNIRDVKIGLGKGIIKEVYSDNSFLVKFENENNKILFLDNGHRYDRDGRIGSRSLIIIEQKEIGLRLKIAKILNTNKIESFLNKKGVLNNTQFINHFKEKGYSPTTVKNYLNNILDKNNELCLNIDGNYFYNNLKINKEEIRNYFKFLKEYYLN